MDLTTLKSDWNGLLKAVNAVALLEKSKWADAQWKLAGIALDAKDYAGTAKHLVAVEKNWDTKLAVSDLDENFKGFLASKEGEAWAKGRKVAKK